MNLFDALGFQWDRSAVPSVVPAYTIERVSFRFHLSSGINAISVPAAKVQEFNEKMVRLYVTRDASEMMAFLVDCHPEWR